MTVAAVYELMCFMILVWVVAEHGIPALVRLWDQRRGLVKVRDWRVWK